MLITAMDQGNTCVEDQYVTTDWSEFAAARDAAQVVLDGPDATQQQIDNANAALLDAMMALRYKADKGILNNLVRTAQSLASSGYTTASVERFN